MYLELIQYHYLQTLLHSLSPICVFVVLKHSNQIFSRSLLTQRFVCMRLIGRQQRHVLLPTIGMRTSYYYTVQRIRNIRSCLRSIIYILHQSVDASTNAHPTQRPRQSFRLTRTPREMRTACNGICTNWIRPVRLADDQTDAWLWGEQCLVYAESRLSNDHKNRCICRKH